MKVLVGFLIIILAISCGNSFLHKFVKNKHHLTPEQLEKLKTHTLACVQQYNMSVPDSLLLVKGEFSKINEKHKCFLNCFMERTELMSNGVVQNDVFEKKLGKLMGEKKTKDTMELCNTLKGEDNCDTAFKLFECYYKHKYISATE